MEANTRTAPTAQARPLDLWPDTVADLYPDSPGYARSSDTSRAAAEAFKVQADTLRGRVLAEYVRAHPGGLTANEAAELTDIPLINCRPRVAELHSNNYLADSGERVKQPNGRSVAVYVATRWALEAANAG